VVLFQWEAGQEPQLGDDLAKPFQALGEAAARMHLHVMQWQRPHWFTRHTWNFETALGEDMPRWGRWREGLGVTTEMEPLFARTVAVIGRRLSAYGQSADRFGLVHGDLRLANLLVDGDQVKVIDFDDCGFSWFMYDAATPVSFFEHEPQVPTLIEHWKEGYRRVRPLSPADENEIPTFVMLRRLLLVAWIGTRRDTELAKSKGIAYSDGTVDLCEQYLAKHG
jgi:Ser/Thr protein kinase RdoA (MazF antagonist)